MRDDLLKAMLQPTNMLMSLARWPDGRWRITNVTSGDRDVYKVLLWSEQHRDRLTRIDAAMRQSGAVAHEMAIMRPVFNVIEEIDVRGRP